MSEIEYPLNASVKPFLPFESSVLMAMRLVRNLSFKFDMSHAQVEMLMVVGSGIAPSSKDRLRRHMNHIPDEMFRNSLTGLVNDSLLISDETSSYELSEVAKKVMKSVDINQLVSKLPD